MSITDPAIVAPNVRDLNIFATTMAGWLGERIPKARDLRLTDLRYPLGAGMSHETILFDASWTEDGRTMHRGMVVRIKPTRHFVYQDDMFDQQYRLMQLMHDSGGVRVARPLWIEHDPELLGAPYFVMEKVAGRVAVSYPPYSQTGWLVDAAPADRRRMWVDAVTQLAAIQKVPVADGAFLNLPGDFAEHFDQETDRWRRYLDWIDPVGKLVLLRDGFDRLRARKPVNRPPGIVWGDARLGNMMIADDFSVAAVMDWEQPSLGGALHDLGWWLYSDHVQTAGRGIPVLDGMGSRDETITLWSEIAGKSAADIDWYEIFVVFKMECLGVRMQVLRGMAAVAEPGSQTARYLAR
ncbi:phosphotransferase family protein [Sphingomonas sp. SUN039]|uniref:phosphotransferase family protein n=1 Tax=Sphingomonas sp. SUN039 TaxID=2937787 RepID=UPI00216442EA|nr:phosphotransferase family protein [Sphingomonas sp. SUN039]UVO53628.1 phosphotransferase family protein [Sphingomonas sp. SUN039]